MYQKVPYLKREGRPSTVKHSLLVKLQCALLAVSVPLSNRNPQTSRLEGSEDLIK